MPLSVSIITPSYNQGRYLERTIRSVLAQPGPFEYLVMDGGSGDESVEILKRYSPRIEWVSEQDRGQADAVNKGLARATGEVIGWLNSDDIFYPGAIAAAADFLERRPDVDVVYGNGNHIDEYDRVIEPYPTEDWDFERLKERCFLCQPAVFFRRSVVERFGPLDVQWHYALDYEYWLRLGKNGARFARIGAVLAGSRLHAETKTLGSRVKVHAENNDMLRSLFGRVPDRWLFNYAHAVLDDRGVRRGNLRFTVEMTALAWWSALRWNRRISADMLRQGGGWIGGAVGQWLSPQSRGGG
ncbi:MAG TPA: glycosyltransferase family 2 protein [Bryobacteraceae bacterium]|nr:glycosyltransferase family 2 protein [Bryobacteraceae bacterium]